MIQFYYSVGPEVRNIPFYEKERDNMFLSSMRHKNAIPFLVDVLKNDKDGDNRGYVAIILGDIRDPSAIPALEDALNDRNRNVRQLSSRALKKITGKDYEWDK